MRTGTAILGRELGFCQLYVSPYSLLSRLCRAHGDGFTQACCSNEEAGRKPAWAALFGVVTKHCHYSFSELNFYCKPGPHGIYFTAFEISKYCNQFN